MTTRWNGLLAAIRITSYNVCYTKLLRLPRLRWMQKTLLSEFIAYIAEVLDIKDENVPLIV